MFFSKIIFIPNAKKKKNPRSFQHTLDWVLNHMQYLHLFPVTAMCWRWTHRRKSSFKKISVTESMFTIIEARKRTRGFGNSCAVLQFCPCLLPTASLRLSSQSSFPGARHLNQTRSASPGSRTHTSGSASQSRSSKPRGAAARIAPRWHRGTGAAPAAARHAAAAGSPRGRRWAPLAAAGGRHRAARGGGAERPARSPPCPALPALPAPGRRRLCPLLSLSRFSNLSSFFFFFFALSAAKALRVLLS